MAASPDHNPYQPPTESAADSHPEAPRFRPLAVFIGWLADVGFTMVTSIGLGVVAGVWLIVQGIPPEQLQSAMNNIPWVHGVGLLFGACGTLLGAYIAAWMGRTMPLAHATAVGIVSLLTGLVPLLLLPEMQPVWVGIAGTLAVIPAALFGGWLRARRAAR